VIGKCVKHQSSDASPERKDRNIGNRTNCSRRIDANWLGKEIDSDKQTCDRLEAIASGRMPDLAGKTGLLL
jgi:hypothetical protein